MEEAFMDLEMIGSELEIDIQKAAARFAGNRMLYMPKPIDFQILKETMAELLKKPPQK